MSKGSKTKTTIELNGKLYDARTGKVVEAPAKAVAAAAVVKPAPTPTIKPATPVVKAPASKPVAAPVKPAATAPKPTNGTIVDGFTKRRVARTGPSHAVTTLEKSKTLMRPAVKKPKAVTGHAPTAHHGRLKKEDPQRLERAKSAPKSEHIRRFSPITPHKVIKKEAILPVASQRQPAAQQFANKVASLATSTETHVKESVDIIEESLRNANSHLEKFEGKVANSGFWSRIGFRSKTANIASLSFAGLLLIGFFAYQNTPSIEMRIASTRSDVSASLPKYRPAGFSAGKDIKSEPGKVSVSFRSNTDDKKFTVTQQASNWSSDSLLSNHVLANKQPYQTYQDAGKTVFIYDNSNATWVNGGVWYRVDGNASLTSDQLLRIANSF